MFLLSNLFDPRYAFLVLSPVIFSLSKKSGLKVMWVTVLAEWINQVMKWMLMGERPFWWVHTSDVYDNVTNPAPIIRQTHMTCETGPGSPSGHAMVTSAVWFVVISCLLKDVKSLRNPITSTLLWLTYLLSIVAVSVSRLYLAAHFPHQTMLGAVIGLILGIYVNQLDVEKFKRSSYVLGTIGMFSSAMITYYIIRNVLNIDPMWTLDNALKYCIRRDYVHLDTTPFFSMMRYCGFFFGMGLGLATDQFKHVSKSRVSINMKIVMVILSFMLCKVSEKISLPIFNMALFYTMAFLLNTLLPFLFISTIPYLVVRSSSIISKKTQ